MNSNQRRSTIASLSMHDELTAETPMAMYPDA
jgi:hypothetical protein